MFDTQGDQGGKKTGGGAAGGPVFLKGFKGGIFQTLESFKSLLGFFPKFGFVERGIINNSFLSLIGGWAGLIVRVLRINALKLISCLDFFLPFITPFQILEA